MFQVFPIENYFGNRTPASGRKGGGGNADRGWEGPGFRAWGLQPLIPEWLPRLFRTPQTEREGQAPLRGLCELRPLKVCRQTPNLFPGVRHLGPIRPAADEPQTRQPKGRGSRGGTGRAEGQETLRDAATGRARLAPEGAGPEKPQPRPLRVGGLSWSVRSLRGCGEPGLVSVLVCQKAKLIKCYFKSLFALFVIFWHGDNQVNHSCFFSFPALYLIYLGVVPQPAVIITSSLLT